MPKTNVPSYLRHKATDQAIVILRGKMFYLGKYKSKESRAKYNELIAEFLANNCKLPPTRTRKEITVDDLALKFLEWAEGYYVAPNGKPTASYGHCQIAMKPFIQHYDKKAVSEFGPLSLKWIRDKWIEQGLARKTINQWCAIIKQAVKWGVENELVDVEIFQALDAVTNLKAGRTKAREYRDIPPVDDETFAQMCAVISGHSHPPS